MIPAGLLSLQNVHQNRLQNHFSDLEKNYFSSKSVDAFVDPENARDSEFAATLLRCSKYSRFRTIASLHYADNFFNFASSIVSSIEFDKDDQYFATAGVTKKIKLFDYEAVTTDYHRISSSFITKSSRDTRQSSFVEFDGVERDERTVENLPKYPLKEIACNSKIR